MLLNMSVWISVSVNVLYECYMFIQIILIGYRRQFWKTKIHSQIYSKGLLVSVAPGVSSAQRSCKRLLLDVSASCLRMHSCDLLVCFLRRCAARGLRGTEALVLYCLLRAQQSGRGSVPGFLHQRARRWLHRSIPPITATDSVWASSQTSTATPLLRTPGGTSGKVRYTHTHAQKKISMSADKTNQSVMLIED